MQPIAIHTQSANLTEEQFYMLCADNNELRLERDKDKNIIVMTPSFSKTGMYHSNIGYELNVWNKKNKSGIVFDSSAGFTLPNTAMRAPDVSWISNERWNSLSEKEKDKFAHVCPDFVIEVRSDSDSLKQQKEKMEEWITNGCRFAWLIDIENKTTLIYKPNTEITEQPFTTTLSGENILPGFELKLSEIIS